MTTPTDAQIGAAARAIFSATTKSDINGLNKCREVAKAALTAAAEVHRVLKETDAFCPSCGHNRDKSSVSSIDHGDFKSCQKCGAEWAETAAAEVGDQVIWEMWREGDIKDKQDVINATIERCAQVAENYGRTGGRIRPSHKHVAAAIRTLKDKPCTE